MLARFNNPAIVIISLALSAGLSFSALYVGQLEFALIAIVALLVGLAIFSKPLYALLFYIAFIPLEEFIVLESLGTLTRLAAIVFAAAYLYHRRFRVNLGSFPLPAWLWLAWAALSLIWSQDPQVQGLFQLVQLFIMAVLVADYVRQKPQILWPVFIVYTLACVFIALTGVTNFFTGLDASGFTQDTRTSAFEGQSVAHFAFYLLPAFFSSLFITLRSKTAIAVRMVTLALSFIFLLAILLSGTRGAWLALGLTVILVYLPKLRLSQLMVLLVAGSIGFAALTQVPAFVDFIGFRGSTALESGGAGRFNIWLVGSQLITENPVFGVGFRNFAQALDFQLFESSSFNLDYSRPFRSQVAHNIYYQILAELGLVGLVLWALWLIPMLRSKVSHELWILVLSILVAMLIGGMTNPELNRKYFWLSLALAEGLRQYQLGRNTPKVAS